MLIKTLKQKISNIFSNDINNSDKNYLTTSFSQEGEDILIRKIFNYKEKGIYIDVGAHHPKKWSITYLLYKTGWRGINIEPIPGSKKLFNQVRPEDINLEYGISNEENILTYYIFKQEAYNTFSKKLANEYQKVSTLVKNIPIQVLPLSYVTTKYYPKIKHIDFINIDVEGYELQVLQSFDWGNKTVSVIMVEILDLNIEEIKENLIVKFLKEKGFYVFSKCFHSVCFIHKRFNLGYQSLENIKSKALS